MNLSKLSQEKLLARCAWCHKVLSKDKECFGVMGRVWPAARPVLAGHEGKLVPMRLSAGQEIIGIVPTADSDARAAGHDLCFQVCSKECGAAISGAIRAELPGPN
jgi:hypothetical protein